MRAFKISDINIKIFMHKLLKEDTFDNFEIRGIEICSFTKFEISGVLNDNEQSDDIKVKFCRWENLKPYVFQIIKGNRKPSSIKIIFSLPSDEVDALHTNASALFLNMIFNGTEVVLTTATSQKTFSLDKVIDTFWSDHVAAFFDKNEIPVSIIE